MDRLPVNAEIDPRALEGRVIAITGAGGSIGREMARTFASAGASVALLDSRLDAVEAAAASLPGPQPHVAATVDVTARDSVRSVLNHVRMRLGEVDVMVNNAGVTSRSGFLDASAEDFERTYRVNALGVLLGMQEAARQMIDGTRESPGKLITTLSSVISRSSAEYAAYAASKMAALSLVRSSARALAEHGITSNALAPGPMSTHMHGERGREVHADAGAALPLGRLGTVLDLAPSALFLASHSSDWMTGQVMHIDGGASLA
jgi:meso-butanediol dehydrogenase/(S,S)-butanediol dehydrogenase/diacetyl reductase